MNVLPKEKLDFFRLNARVARTYAPCAYCGEVTTKGRDWLGDGQCDKCLSKSIDDMKGDLERTFKEPSE